MLSERDYILKYLQKTPPKECNFKVGDIVTYTNEYGVKFYNREIIGFSTFMLNSGRFIHLSKEAFWFPNRPEDFKLERSK